MKGLRGLWRGLERRSGARATACLATCVLGLAPSCRKHEPTGSEPAASATPRAGVCAEGGGRARYDETLFVRSTAGFCIDPYGDTRAYGATAPAPLEDVCSQLLGEDCEPFQSYGLERVTTLRYVDDQGTSASVNAALLRFSKRSGAYGAFTRRVLGDRDPAELAMRPLDAGAAAAMASGVAYVWRGNYVLELAYSSERETPAEARASSDRVLPALARALGEQLPGEKSPLEEVALLPREHLLPLGVSYVWDKLLGVSSTGPGAVGHYSDGKKRWRVVMALRDDEQGAKDLRETFARAGMARVLKKQEAVEVRFPPANAAPAQLWVFVRRGPLLLGLGDEVHGAAQPPDEPKRDLESKLTKLKRIAASVPPSALWRPDR